MSKKKKKDKKKHKPADSSASAGQSGTGRTFNLREVKLPAAPKPLKPAEIRGLREEINASQALFAKLLNVSSNAVESWEQGIRAPRQATLKLLHIVKKNPSVLLG
jgi:putative transcriptional regulator